MARTRTRRRSTDPRLTDIQSAPRERWSHGGDYDVIELDGAVEARRVQRVSGAVDALRRSGRVGDAEVGAAARWVGDFERSLRSSYCDPATAGIRGGGSNSGPELRWAGGIDAATRLQQVRVALGADGVALLVAHVHLELSLRAAAEVTGATGGAARGRAADVLAGVLRELAAHYVECDRHGARGIMKPRAVRNPEMEMAA